MGTEHFGECSRKSDNVETLETERPLKKAKYVWQVKGKYHLKASYENNNNKTNDEDLQQQQHHHHDNSVKCDGGTRYIDKFLEKTETILDGGDGDADLKQKNIDRSLYDEIPVTLVSPNPDNLDYYLRKWQARQIARGYIDNTINSVLETWVSVPAPFDAEDFVENCDNDGHIEDEGILMAIQAHGLQSNKSSKHGPSLSFVRPDELADNTLDKIDTVRHHHYHHHHGNDDNEDSTEMHDDDDDVPINTTSSSSSSDDRDGEEVNNQDSTVYPVDILNAAILVAIEKKGLSSFNHHG